MDQTNAGSLQGRESRPPAAPASRWGWLTDPLSLVEVFLLTNVAFVGVEIIMAHSINEFANPYEWIPVGFSAIASVMLVTAMTLTGLRPPVPGFGPRSLRRSVSRWLGLLVAAGCVVVGVMGMVFHLESQFFQNQSLHNLVYTAPFVAPLVYAGLGLVLVLNRMVSDTSIEWGRWVLLLAMGGFVGNFILSLVDHAINDFYVWAEWISVISSAFAVAFLLLVAVRPKEVWLRRTTWAVLALQVVTGVVGFGFHFLANLERPGTTLWEQFIYGTPVFSPLLFADIAILGALGLWGVERVLARAEDSEPVVAGAVAPSPA